LVLRKIFGPKTEEVKRTGENRTISVKIGNSRPVLLGRTNKEG